MCQMKNRDFGVIWLLVPFPFFSRYPVVEWWYALIPALRHPSPLTTNWQWNLDIYSITHKHTHDSNHEPVSTRIIAIGNMSFVISVHEIDSRVTLVTVCNHTFLQLNDTVFVGRSGTTMDAIGS